MDYIVLRGTLDRALEQPEPGSAGEHLHQAAAEVLTPQSQDAIAENFRSTRSFTDHGITYVDHDARERTPVIASSPGTPPRTATAW